MQEDNIRIIDNPFETPESANEDRKFSKLIKDDPPVEEQKTLKDGTTSAPQQIYHCYPAEKESGYVNIELMSDQTLRDTKNQSWLNSEDAEQSPENVQDTELKVNAVVEQRKQGHVVKKETPSKLVPSSLNRASPRQEYETIDHSRATRNEVRGRKVIVKEPSDQGRDVQRNQTMQERWMLLDGDESAVRGIPRDNLRWRVGDGASNVFHPADESCEPAWSYFFYMWFPRFLDLVDIMSDVIIMCSLESGAARTMQGCFLFFPYVVLWGSRYNTSQFEAWYIQSLSKEKLEMPMKAWVNTVPWTGIPTVCLLEWYVLMYMVYFFPIIFWRHQAQNQRRPFQLSRDIFDKSRDWYIRVLRLVFENLPTTVLLLVVLSWYEDSAKMVFFSMVTSIISISWTIAALVSTSASRGQPIHMVIISSLLIPPNFALLPKHYGLAPFERRGR